VGFHKDTERVNLNLASVDTTPYMVYHNNMSGKDFIKKLMKVWMGAGQG